MQKKNEKSVSFFCLPFLSMSRCFKLLWIDPVQLRHPLFFTSKHQKRLEMIESYERFHSPLKTQLGFLSSVLLLPVGNF